jgi:hypothetical protein
MNVEEEIESWKVHVHDEKPTQISLYPCDNLPSEAPANGGYPPPSPIAKQLRKKYTS